MHSTHWVPVRMIQAWRSEAVLALTLCVGVVPLPARALSTAFTYQGQLQQSGSVYNGQCDLQFKLFDAASGGTQKGSTQVRSAQMITNGLFTVALDFGGSPFDGNDRWLQIGVSCPSSASPSYSILSPLQQLTATPYALYAAAAGSANGLSCSGCVTTTDLAPGAVTGSTIAVGSIQQSNLAFTPVLSVGANSPLASSGGQSPSISLTGTVSVANGGTGADTAVGARGNLGAAMSGANSDITALLGFTGSNVALGQNALHVNTGTNDTAVGQNALSSNTSGIKNTAVGAGALSANNGGGTNTAVGYAALQGNTSGASNTAVGVASLLVNTGGVGNTAVGSGALEFNTADNNTAVGNSALNSNSSGTGNTAVGAVALNSNTTGGGNTAVGNSALASNQAGTSNTALGADALSVNTGSENTAVGTGALQQNMTASHNTAVGVIALGSTTTGHDNTALGWEANTANNTGNGNTAMGSLALFLNGGNNNTAVGNGALGNLMTGDGNIALGSSAGNNLTGAESQNIYVGAAGVDGESNTIRIGGINPISATYIAGIRGKTTGVADGVAVLVDNKGQLGTISSSRRFKTDIHDMGDASDRLMQLRPVTFKYKPAIDPSGSVQYGLIAEEVAAILPDLVAHDQDGHIETVKYHLLSVLLLNEIQKQAHEITAQRKQIVEQARQTEEQERQIREERRQLSDQAQQAATLQKQVEELSTLKAETAALHARIDAFGVPQTVANRRSRCAQDTRPAAF